MPRLSLCSHLFSGNIRHHNPAERALHELDVYKTPLVPTRLRSSGKTGSSLPGVPDLFKSKRASKLVLMQDFERKDVQGKKKKKRPAEAKPYSGEGGMRRLLAKRKLEETDAHVDKSADRLSSGQTGGEKSSLREIMPTTSSRQEVSDDLKNTELAFTFPEQPHVPPLPFSPGGSSLRVGRTKNRTSIPRPKTRASKSGFSAVFDEDETMEEDIQNEGSGGTQQENLAYKAPEGFTFAKVRNAIHGEILLSNFFSLWEVATPISSIGSKEPPIPSLPFSLTASPTKSTTSSASKSIQTVEFEAPLLPPSAPYENEQLVSTTKLHSTALQNNNSLLDETIEKKGTSAMPNFFASSTAYTKPLSFSIPPLALSTASPNQGGSLTSSAPTTETGPKPGEPSASSRTQAEPSPATFVWPSGGGSAPPYVTIDSMTVPKFSQPNSSSFSFLSASGEGLNASLQKDSVSASNPVPFMSIQTSTRPKSPVQVPSAERNSAGSSLQSSPPLDTKQPASPLPSKVLAPSPLPIFGVTNDSTGKDFFLLPPSSTTPTSFSFPNANASVCYWCSIGPAH